MKLEATHHFLKEDKKIDFKNLVVEHRIELTRKERKKYVSYCWVIVTSKIGIESLNLVI